MGSRNLAFFVHTFSTGFVLRSFDVWAFDVALSLSLSLSHARQHAHSLSLSTSLSYTHTLSLAAQPSLSLTHLYSLSLSLSLSFSVILKPRMMKQEGAQLLTLNVLQRLFWAGAPRSFADSDSWRRKKKKLEKKFFSFKMAKKKFQSRSSCCRSRMKNWFDDDLRLL